MYVEAGEALRDDVFRVDAGSESAPGSRRMWHESTGEIVFVTPESTRLDDDTIVPYDNHSKDNDSELMPHHKSSLYALADYSKYRDPECGDERIPKTATVRERQLYDFILRAGPIELGPIDRQSVGRVLSALSGCKDLEDEHVLARFKRTGLIRGRGSTEPLALREVREDLPTAIGVAARTQVYMDSIQPFRHPKAACSAPSNSGQVDSSYVDRFMPGRGESIDAPLRQCLGCAALGPCFEYAMLKTSSQTPGVWAGLSAAQRKTLTNANGGAKAAEISESVAQRAEVIWGRHAKRLRMPPPENVVFAKLFVPEEISSAPTKLQPS